MKNSSDLNSGKSTQPHFARDYEMLVDMLLANFSLDEAMSMAVGGSYEKIGKIERSILEYAGLKSGMSLIDVGCGSGRLASALSGMDIRYLGTDVVQRLLDYAKRNAPSNFRFLRHLDLNLPVEESTVDMICAFSVFTHLQHEESYIYLEDFKRALRPNGIVVFSFLEFSSDHLWGVFEQTVKGRKNGYLPHLNIFIEREAIHTWCGHLGFEVVEIVNGLDTPWGEGALGQCTALLRKPIT